MKTLTQKIDFLKSVALFLLLGTSSIFAQSDPTNCITFTNCPTDIVVCANSYNPDNPNEWGASASWQVPSASETCSGGPGSNSFVMDFELNESLLGNDCWDFDYVQRVGGSGGEVKLFSSSDLGNDNIGYIITPYLFLEVGEPLSIDVTYTDGAYNLNLYYIDEMGNEVFSGNSQAINLLGVGTHTVIMNPNIPSDGSYRIKFEFEEVSGNPSNMNLVDKISIDGVVVEGTCTGGVDFTVSGPDTNSGFFPIGTTPITYTATYTSADGTIITDTCSFNIVVTDTPPTITCPANISQDVDAGLCNATISTPVPIVSDSGCDGNDLATFLTVTSTRDDGLALSDPYPIGVTTITHSATDPSGNNITCDQTITITGGTTPEFGVSPAAIADLNCDDPLPTQETLTASNCEGPVAVVASVDPYTPDCSGYTITYRWIAGVTEVTQSFNVLPDTTAPSFVETLPVDTTVECDAVPSAEILTAIDNCNNATVTFNETSAPGSCSDSYTITRIWTASDDCGNDSIHTQTITVQDITPPDFVETLPADTTVECDAVPTAETLTATDNCSNASVSFNEVNTAGSCLGAYTLTRTWIATDECGNETSHIQTITVQDTTPPNFVQALPADTTVECDAVPTAETLTATDNCGNASVSFEEINTSGSCTGAYTLTRTWTATDECGNQTLHTQTITVEDTTPPTFVEALPADTTVECDAVPVAVTLTATDNCGNASIIFNEVNTAGSCSDAYTLTRTWTATDECGNQILHTQTITVEDTTPPTFVEALPADTTVECDAIPVAETLTATDNCGNASIIFNEVNTAGSCTGAYTLTRTWTATDECGNQTLHTQTITVEDTTPPTFVEVLPADTTVECDAIPVAETLTATDNCGNASITYNEVNTAGSCSDAYTLTRTWTATDECGNQTSHVQIVTVQDTTPPAFVEALPADTTVECDAVPSVVTLTATDNCGNASVSFVEVNTAGNCQGAYTLTRTWTATDECGNQSSHVQTITVEDTTPPSFNTVAADQTVACDGMGNITELQAWLNTNAGATATDNCSGVTWSNNFVSLSNGCGETGLALVTFTATDECGNSNTTSALFTIIDLLPPTIDTQASDLTVECDGNGNLTELNNWLGNNGGAISSDICGEITWSNNYSTLNADCGGTGSALVTFTATDDCGNSSTTTATFTIEDTSPPSFVEALPVDTIVECDAVLNAETLTATDSCGNATVTFDEVNTPGSCPNSYTLTRTWTAIDECGNQTSHIQTINVQDTTPPSIDLQASNVVVECDGSGNNDAIQNWLDSNGGATASDNCGVVTWSNDYNGATSDCSSPVVVTFTATDECGNVSTTSASYAIQDTTPPTIDTIATDLTVECDGSGNTQDLQDWLDSFAGATASDDCSAISWSNDFSQLSDLCGATGSATVTFTATDGCGNSSSTAATFTIEDTAAPSFVEALPSDATVECDTVPNEETLTATDSCGDATVTFDEVNTPGSCPNSYTLTRTWTATDECGNESSHVQTITVQDTTPPTFVEALPADATVECDTVPTAETLTATDSCGDATVTFNEVNTAENCPNSYTLTRTWTATDECGNESSHVQTITVQDTTPPSFVEALPVDTIVECYAVANAETLTATDSCGNATVTFDEVNTPGSCPNSYTLTRTWTAIDECGNQTSHIQTINVQDTTPPSIDLQASNVVVECDGSGNNDAIQNWLDSNGGATASDNCGVVTWSNDYNGATSDCSSPVVVTFTATDECGNVSTTSASYAIQDTTPPTIDTIATDLTVECDGSGNTQDLQDWLDSFAGATASDDCSAISWSNDFNQLSDLCGATGSATVTFTATDGCGNSSSTAATFTIEDTAAPSFVEALPSDITVECNTVPAEEALTATDSCGDVTVTFEELNTAGACPGAYTLTRTWTATDECGNESSHVQTVTVQDTTPPTFVEALPADATVECDVVPTAETLTATDNCGNVTVTFEELNTAGACPGAYTLTRTWTATDECGNQTSHVQIVTVQDTTPPSFVEALPADTTVECDAVPSAETLTATDSCGNATVTFDEVNTPGSCPNSYTLTRTWTATDECGNQTSHIQTINVQDTTPPSFVEVLPSDVSVQCDAVSTAETLTATDSCGEATVTFDEVNTPGSCPNSYTLTRTWTATDECGNETSHLQTITVQDTTPPSFVETLPSDVSVQCDAVPNAETLTATDNCGNATVTFDEVNTAGNCPGAYTLTRTWTATDECGNETSHSQTITVQDTTPPTFVEALPADISVQCDAVPTAETLNATDNCGSATVTFNELSTAGNCPGTYTLIRTWTATDECGNETSHTQTITVQDTTPPTFVEALPADVSVECDTVPTAETLTAVDNCGNTTVTFDEINTAGSCPGAYTLTRTWTATDECGNQTSHMQTIIIEDTTAPTFVEALPVDISVQCDAVPTAETLTATDSCGDAIVTFDEVNTSGSCPGAYTLTRTWTASDECGNESSHVQTITVEDTTAPILGSSLPTVIDVNCSEIPVVPTPMFEDNCSENLIINFEEVNNSQADGNDYSIEYTWTVTDECGNTAVFSQTVNVTMEESVTEVIENSCIDDGTIDLFDYINTSNTDGEWVVISGNATVNSGFFDPTQSGIGDYVFEYSVIEDSCLSVTRVMLNINDDCVVLPCGSEDVNISTAITPNGDQWNEYFEVTGVEECGFTIEIMIFNRWGAKIFESKNYQNNWNGAAPSGSVGNAEKVPTGTYYYVVKLKDSGLDPFSGPIYVGTK
ncbi:HYR-like domain-containing protein [Mangrovimonas aestuarii]|uniref:HYR-like domain-containing protein n=1 Tax=Mangrovimonas aestuarii TaxID=3018443 RepID=UPI002379E5DE|nr:gliding motility-associated C-terminal domain-containing protein [Mangrovimonas aestuarii]